MGLLWFCFCLSSDGFLGFCMLVNEFLGFSMQVLGFSYGFLWCISRVSDDKLWSAGFFFMVC